MKSLLSGVACIALLSFSTPSYAGEGTKLYRLDCGSVDVIDLNVFSDTDQYVGQSKNLTVSCYLINKGDNWLLWDTGLNGSIAEKPEGLTSGPFVLKVKETLPQQLAKINLKPEDITHVALSHSHFDHSGNVNLFSKAALIIQQAEYETLVNTPELAGKYHMDASNFDYFLKEENKAQLNIISGDTDLFGDGSVKAISLPGHTPGHMALKLRLPKTGVVFLSGDQWHFDENRMFDGVPSFNYNRSDTISSSDKLNRLVANTQGTLIIQHEAKDIEKIPAFPAYLD